MNGGLITRHNHNYVCLNIQQHYKHDGCVIRHCMIRLHYLYLSEMTNRLVSCLSQQPIHIDQYRNMPWEHYSVHILLHVSISAAKSQLMNYGGAKQIARGA